MHYVEIAYKSFSRRPLRSTLTSIGLAIAVAAVVSLVGLSQGFERALLNLYYQRNVDLIVQRAGGTLQVASGIDERLADKIATIPGVKRVISGLMDVVAFAEHDLFAVIINGWPPDGEALERVTIKSGRRLHEGNRRQVMLGAVLAGNLGKKVGDKVEIYTEPFEVVGIFESFSVYENGAVFILLGELQELMDRPHQVTGFVVETADGGNPRAVEDVRQKIEALDPQLSAVATAEFVRGISQIRVVRAAAWVTSIIAVGIGIVGVLNTMIMSVFERARELGTLRAIGWRKGRVMRLVLTESLLLSTVGAILGAGLGSLAVRLLSHWNKLSGLVDGGVSTNVVIQGFAVAIIVGLLGAAYPAWWAANLWPVEALRRK